MRALALLLLLASPAAAQQALTAEEFEAIVTGRTLTYGEPGQTPYGIEHYFPNRRVTWAFADSDDCVEGTWRQQGPASSPAICFDYEGDIEPQCWRIFREGDGLRADYLGDGPSGDAAGGSVLYEVEDGGALVCGGAGV
ncbi:hypothetical protein [Rubellimicrobium aerolatum]|uniref:Uncharacterized protein n=1 Tax=Rubellimicrobium aerolatum TaxID=490979 RepID=A0ABW0SBE6_9RHOB|nr:hypothetical protein [Rubellimicrobium aerolatum]MBP1805443.1 hypothetical protein [Rubellimicrobium aerolatum]